ncbi:hypothetical protein CDAR_381821 [Caerostris darwini]|uniref:Ribosomal protein L32 n=1 Tax=Caerostris darwini TaxID=1538125 RepID=A0AAV4V695_9ARAC|nr:hypothetical protein CDAR_381821 [Caerostris darwini]
MQGESFAFSCDQPSNFYACDLLAISSIWHRIISTRKSQFKKCLGLKFGIRKYHFQTRKQSLNLQNSATPEKGLFPESRNETVTKAGERNASRLEIYLFSSGALDSPL